VGEGGAIPTYPLKVLGTENWRKNENIKSKTKNSD